MRRLTAEDARAMATIHAESFAPPFGSGGWDALEMSAHIQKDLCFGIDQSGELSGFIILSCVAGEAEILTIATGHAYRRQGLGAQLLGDAIKNLRDNNVKDLFLEVAEDNPAAIGLYRKLGFDPMGRRPAYYKRAKGRVAAITFSKKL